MSFSKEYFLTSLFITSLMLICIVCLGFENAVLVQAITIFVFVSLLFLTKRINSIRHMIVVMLLMSFMFDSEPFLIGSFNFRLWYFLAPFLIYFVVLDSISMRFSSTTWFIVIYIITVCLVEVLMLRAYLDGLKYFFFYVLPICFIVNSLHKENQSIDQCSELFVLVSSPFLIYGVIQFIFSVIYGFENNILYPPVYNIEPRPVSFFSETTWLSELALFSFLLSFTLKNLRVAATLQLVCFFLLITTVTRNSYLALLSSFFIVLMMSFSIMKFNRNFLYYILVISLLFLTVATIVPVVTDLILRLIGRFTDLDTGGGGRLEAFAIAGKMFIDNPGSVFGQGFEWSKNIVAGEGSSLGAKAFNSVIMFSHIFGIIFLLVLAFHFFYRFVLCYKVFREQNCTASRVKALVFIIFGWSYISISMFAPIHQYPMGIGVISIFLYAAYNVKRLLPNA